MGRDLQLIDFLTEAFPSRDELVAFGDLVAPELKWDSLLPGQGAPTRTIAKALVRKLSGRGYLRPDFFQHLRRECPRRAEDIQRIEEAPTPDGSRTDITTSDDVDALAGLLLRTFPDADDLALFPGTLPRSQALVDALPELEAPPAFAAALAGALAPRHGDAAASLFDTLLRARPDRYKDIADVARRWDPDFLPRRLGKPSSRVAQTLQERAMAIRFEGAAPPSEEALRGYRHAYRCLIIGNPRTPLRTKGRGARREKSRIWLLGISKLNQVLRDAPAFRKAWHEAVRVLRIQAEQADAGAAKLDGRMALAAALHLADQDLVAAGREPGPRSLALTRRCLILEDKFLKYGNPEDGFALARDAIRAFEDAPNVDPHRAFNAARWPILVAAKLPEGDKAHFLVQDALRDAERAAREFIEMLGGEHEQSHMWLRHLNSMISEARDTPTSPETPPIWDELKDALEEVRCSEDEEDVDDGESHPDP